MASRLTFSDLSTPPLPGGGTTGLMRQYSERFKTLFDASCLPLITVAGTANAVTAVLDPALDTGGLVDGMKFEITWAAANTAGVTLALNGGSAISVLNAAGGALIAGDLATGLRSLIEYVGGSYRVLSPLASSFAASNESYYQAFTVSGTWTKPAGLDADRMVVIEAWAGGGGGSSLAGGGGGGGGGYARLEMRYGDVPSSVSVTIGAGGSVNSTGGNTTFGSLLTAFAGGAAAGNSGGGGGGGELSQGSANGGAVAVSGGAVGGGTGSAGGASSGTALSIWGGGGGGGGGGTGNGGAAVYGGGGGAGSTGSAGPSKFGGTGGGPNAAGTAPGGGGGRGAAGARGEVRVWIT